MARALVDRHRPAVAAAEPDKRVVREVYAGTVLVNDPCGAHLSPPFGSFKESGFGDTDRALWAIDQHSDPTTTWINSGRGK